jgi:hypothetical protein
MKFIGGYPLIKTWIIDYIIRIKHKKLLDRASLAQGQAVFSRMA